MIQVWVSGKLQMNSWMFRLKIQLFNLCMQQKSTFMTSAMPQVKTAF